MKCRKVYRFPRTSNSIAQSDNIVWFGVTSISKDIMQITHERTNIGLRFRNKPFSIEFTVIALPVSVRIEALYTGHVLQEYTIDKLGKHVIYDVMPAVAGVIVIPLANCDPSSPVKYTVYTHTYLEDKTNSFSDKQDAIADSLQQQLHVIRGELWYDINYGLPLTQKVSSKLEMDMLVANIVASHPDVVEIISFDSQLLNHKYSAKFSIRTKYGDILMSI